MTRPRSEGVSSRMPYSLSPSAWATRSASSASSLNVSTRTIRGDLGPEVPIERQRRLDGVAEDQDERMRHRAGRGEPGEPRAGGRRRADAAAHDRRVVEHVGDVRVDVARAEADDRIRRGRVDALARGGRPAGRLGEHAQERGLVQPEPAVAGRGSAARSPCGADAVAVVERLEHASRPGRRRRARGRAGSWPRRCRTGRPPGG